MNHFIVIVTVFHRTLFCNMLFEGEEVAGKSRKVSEGRITDKGQI